MQSKKSIKDDGLTAQSSNFLLYTGEDGGVHVDVCLADETLWLTQKKMGELFGVGQPAISKHHGSVTVSTILEGSQKLILMPVLSNTGGGTGQIQTGNSPLGIARSQVELGPIWAAPPILIGNMHSQQMSVMGFKNRVGQTANSFAPQVRRTISRMRRFMPAPWSKSGIDPI